MSVQLIRKYYADVAKVIRYGGSSKETAIRTGFQNLLNDYAQQQNLLLIPELEYKTPAGKIQLFNYRISFFTQRKNTIR